MDVARHRGATGERMDGCLGANNGVNIQIKINPINC